MAKKLTLDVITDGGIRFLEFRELKRLGVPHLMTTRDYDTGLKSSGDQKAIERQYRHVLALIGAQNDNFWLLEQVHSNQVVPVTSDLHGEVFAPGRIIRCVDGMITDEAGICMATTFADCVPLVLYDPLHHALANLHSGWKGTLDQIGKVGLEKMTELYGTRPEDLLVFIGPHIQAKDFEVRQDLRDAFLKKFGEQLTDLPNGEYIWKKDPEHWTVNLARIIESMFLNLEVPAENIYAAEESTFERGDLFHSWRRDGKSYGIMSLVALNP